VKNLISIPGTLAVTTILAGLVLVGGTKLVYPHSAIPTAAKPQGWNYPFSCCSGYDCREVGDRSQSKVKISETPQGYRISTTGEIIAYSDKRIKDSPDGEFHWCSVAGADDSRTICLFVPPRSY
jgi:hypothetical protein